MSDKYPALDNEEIVADDGISSDFLSREKELVGDEFKTDQDQDVLAESDDDINEFKEQFPEVGETEPQVPEPVAPEDEEEEFEGFESARNPNETLLKGESQHLKDWKQRRDLEIEERENVNKKKKEDLVQKAQQTIDDFYDNYNNKREQHSAEVLKEQEEFLSNRDDFLKRGTLWDRVNELVTEIGDVPGDDARDKTRFKGLLSKLKGKENVPGAGGY